VIYNTIAKELTTLGIGPTIPGACFKIAECEQNHSFGNAMLVEKVFSLHRSLFLLVLYQHHTILTQELIFKA